MKANIDARRAKFEASAKVSPTKPETPASPLITQGKQLSGKAEQLKPVRQEAGMPEAGLQTGMFGEAPVEVRPKGKGRIAQISMDEQLALEGQRRQFEKEGIEFELRSDPVANYRFKIGGRNVGLESLISIREQSFPEYFTIKQAQSLNP